MVGALGTRNGDAADHSPCVLPDHAVAVPPGRPARDCSALPALPNRPRFLPPAHSACALTDFPRLPSLHPAFQPAVVRPLSLHPRPAAQPARRSRLRPTPSPYLPDRLRPRPPPWLCNLPRPARFRPAFHPPAPAASPSSHSPSAKPSAPHSLPPAFVPSFRPALNSARFRSSPTALPSRLHALPPPCPSPYTPSLPSAPVRSPSVQALPHRPPCVLLAPPINGLFLPTPDLHPPHRRVSNHIRLYPIS